MKRRVVIKGLPKAQSGLETKMHNLRAGLGFNANTMPWPIMAGKLSEPPLQTNDTLKPVPREEANVEAEKGEVAALPTKSGIPDTKKIGGKRHYEGGTPLNLPGDTFIFSDTAKMRIKDPVILAQFGMPPRKNGYTPAEIAKKYDTTPYKKILMDKNADVMQQKTAEIMISNYNLKLAKLALYQESMKGFPQGIPAIAQPYIESMQLDPNMFMQANPGGETDDDQAEADMMGKYGKEVTLPRAQNGENMPPAYRRLEHQPGGGFAFTENLTGNELNDYYKWLGSKVGQSATGVTYDPSSGRFYDKSGNIKDYYAGNVAYEPLNEEDSNYLIDKYNFPDKSQFRKYQGDLIPGPGMVGTELNPIDMPEINITPSSNPDLRTQTRVTPSSSGLVEYASTSSKPREKIVAEYYNNFKDEIKPEKTAAYVEDMLWSGQLPKGFNTAEKARAFVKDNPELYSLFLNNFYLNADSEENAKQMREVAEQLENYNIKNSWGWIAGSQQDMVQNMAGILREKIDRDINTKDINKNVEDLGKTLNAIPAKIKKIEDKLNTLSPASPLILKYRNAIKALKDYEKEVKLARSQQQVGLYEYPPQVPDMALEKYKPEGLETKFQSILDEAEGKATESTSTTTGAPTQLDTSGYIPGAVDTTKAVIPADTTYKPAADTSILKNAEAQGKAEMEAARKRLEGKTGSTSGSTGSSTSGASKSTGASKQGSTSSVQAYDEEPIKKMGGAIDQKVRRVVITGVPQMAYGGYFARGGSVNLPKADDGKIVAPSADVYPVKWVKDSSQNPPMYALKWSDGSFSNKQTTPPTNDQHAETKKLITGSKPSKKVTPEDYERLKKLYEIAKAKDPNGTKYTKEAEEFQKEYHKVLPHEAQRIIAANPKSTGKCKGQGDAYYRWECNEDGIFGERTVQYMQALEKVQQQDDDDKPVDNKTTVTEDKEKDKKTDTSLIVDHLGKTKRYPSIPPSPWVQDVNLTNRAFLNWMGTKGYFPDLVQTRYKAPEFFMQSPERALQENQSQMNMAANILGKTQRPQDFYGGWAAISGPGFNNAANTIANVHGQNINIANQEAAARAQAYNQNEAMNSQRLKQFIDEQNATLQGIQNTRTQRGDEYTKAQNALMSNMANKYNTNLLNPQFAVDDYGMVFFHDPNELKAQDQQLSISKRYQQMLKDNPVEAKTEEGKKRLWEMTKLEAGISSNTYDDPLSEYERAKKKGVIPYAQYPS